MVFTTSPKMVRRGSPLVVWTNHSKEKMWFYRLSQSRVLRVLRHPKREEKGIAPDTVAAMQPAGSKKHPYEIWLMYQLKGGKLKIISCWRYPGVSPLRQPPIQKDDLKFWR